MHRSTNPRRLSRRLWLGVAAVLLGAIGCSGPSPTAGPSDGASLASDGETPFPTGELDPALGWQRIDLGAATPTGLSSAVAFEDGFLASGETGREGRAPVILRSPDGMTWSAETISSGFATPYQLGVIGDRVLAVGAGETNRCAHPYAMDTWARRPDATWAEAPFVDTFCRGYEFGQIVAWHGRPWLVGVGNGDSAVSMTSDDGLQWTVEEEGLVGFQTRAALADEQSVTIVGRAPDDRIAALTSVDGRVFERRPFPAFAPGANVLAATTLAGRGLVFIEDGPHVDVVTGQPDGSWVTAPAHGVSGDEIGRIVDIGDRLVAIGTDVDGLAVLAVSGDGLAWARVEVPRFLDRRSVLHDAAMLDGTAVLVGSVLLPDESSSQGATWVGSAALLGS